MEKTFTETDDMFIKKGRMTKSPLVMTADELKTWEEQEKTYIRQHLFGISQPLVYRKDGILIAEFKDGHIRNV